MFRITLYKLCLAPQLLYLWKLRVFIIWKATSIEKSCLALAKLFLAVQNEVALCKLAIRKRVETKDLEEI